MRQKFVIVYSRAGIAHRVRIDQQAIMKNDYKTY